MPLFTSLRSRRFHAVSGAKNEEREPVSFFGFRSVSRAAKPKIPYLGLSLRRNQTETLATQATIHQKIIYLGTGIKNTKNVLLLLFTE